MSLASLFEVSAVNCNVLHQSDIFKGELGIEDETGKKETLHEGETFFIRKGSKIIFSAPRFAIAFKISAQLPMTL